MKILKLYRFVVLIAVPVLLSSCFAAKDYERPAVVNETYFRTDSLQQDTTSIATLSWKQLFKDPVLQGYIEEGLQNNIDIRVALQQIYAAQAYFKQGKAGYFPTLVGNASVTRNYFSKNGQVGLQLSNASGDSGTRIGTDHFDLFELAGDVSWEADIWGRIRSQKRAFEASYLQSIAAHQAVKTELISQIATSYYQLLSLDEQIRVTSQTVETRKNAVETTTALKDAGNLTAVAVKQTEAQYYQAQGILIDLQRESHLLENTLSILLNREPTAIARGVLKDQQIDTVMQVGTPIQLLRNRPDVIAAEYNLVNAFELTNAARSNFYPSLTINASGGLQSLRPEDLFNTSSLFATLVGGLTQPIFNRRQIRTQYEVSEAQQKQAGLEFRRAILTATKEVSDAYFTYDAALEKIEVKEKEFEAYNVAIDYSEELLDYGLANYLEVLTARENALSSQLELIDSQFTELSSVVELYRALGGGWR